MDETTRASQLDNELRVVPLTTEAESPSSSASPSSDIESTTVTRIPSSTTDKPVISNENDDESTMLNSTSTITVDDAVKTAKDAVSVADATNTSESSSPTTTITTTTETPNAAGTATPSKEQTDSKREKQQEAKGRAIDFDASDKPSDATAAEPVNYVTQPSTSSTTTSVVTPATDSAVSRSDGKTADLSDVNMDNDDGSITEVPTPKTTEKTGLVEECVHRDKKLKVNIIELFIIALHFVCLSPFTCGERPHVRLLTLNLRSTKCLCI